jgi:uncharacterized membrane protein
MIDWMQSTWINNLAVGYAWSWPTLETLHFFGMCVLFGALIIMDLRLVGFEKAAAVIDTDKLYPIALAGFLINLITGIIFCFGDPGRYFINISFQIKMVLLFLAGLNFLYYKLKVEHMLAAVGPGEDTPAIARTVGAASLILWTGVLAFGRLIPYLGTG